MLVKACCRVVAGGENAAEGTKPGSGDDLRRGCRRFGSGIIGVFHECGRRKVLSSLRRQNEDVVFALLSWAPPGVAKALQAATRRTQRVCTHEQILTCNPSRAGGRNRESSAKIFGALRVAKSGGLAQSSGAFVDFAAASRLARGYFVFSEKFCSLSPGFTS